MRLYAVADERRLRLQGQVREWARAGLLEPAQAAQFDAEIAVDLRRTGRMLRLGLALFTALVVVAAVGLVLTLLDLNREGPVSIVAAVAALACLAAAEQLVTRFRFYRHGVEEALAVAAAGLAAFSAALLVSAVYGVSHDTAIVIAGLAVGGAASFGIFLRYGFQYAAVGAMTCLALIPFQLGIGLPLQRMSAAAVLGVAFWRARVLHRRDGDEFPGDQWATLQAAAFVGVYLCLNVPLTTEPFGAFVTRPPVPWFWWTTYAATWVIPALGLLLGIHERDRRMLDVSLAAALATLVTSKLYLGWLRQTWDPMLLGIVLMGAAVIVRRWLAAGLGGQRGGLTPVRLLQSEADAIRMIGIASAVVQPSQPEPVRQEPSGFGGGRSGGGGAGADF